MVINNLIRAHKQSYNTLHRILDTPTSTVKVGLAHHIIYFTKSGSFYSWFGLSNWLINDWLIKKIWHQCDFLGYNYYRSIGASSHTSDLSWEIYPEGLTKLMVKYSQKYNLPIYITENGIDTKDDTLREEYLRTHTQAIFDAKKQGAHIHGYFYWSLLDNFEWALGFKPKFGLIAVDRTTGNRLLKKSAYIYKKIINEAHN